MCDICIKTSCICFNEDAEKLESYLAKAAFRVTESDNNGGKTDYYQLDKAPFKINDFDDFAELRKMNGNQFNIGKVVWTFNTGRHQGTTYERDLNKIIHYAKRELLRLSRES